jgi:hypothetical protein
MDKLPFMKAHRCFYEEIVDPEILEKRQLMERVRGSAPARMSSEVDK